MAILTSIKDALNVNQYKAKIEGLLNENRRLKFIKLTPTQMALSQILSKTKELEMESERYSDLIETKTKAIKELNLEYTNQATYQANEFEQKSNHYDQKTKEYDHLIELKGKDLEDQSTDYDNLIESKHKDYEDLIELKSNEFNKKSDEYKLLIESKTKSVEELNSEYTSVKTYVDNLKSQIITLDEDISMQSFGIYKSRYNLMSSEKCITMHQDIRKKQIEMIKSKEAIEYKQWIVNGNIKDDNQLVDDMTENMIKLVIKIFNDECNSIIDKVNSTNLEVIEKSIEKFFEDLNKLGSITQVKIVPLYLNTKLDELHLCYEDKLKNHNENKDIITNE